MDLIEHLGFGASPIRSSCGAALPGAFFFKKKRVPGVFVA